MEGTEKGEITLNRDRIARIDLKKKKIGFLSKRRKSFKTKKVILHFSLLPQLFSQATNRTSSLGILLKWQA